MSLPKYFNFQPLIDSLADSLREKSTLKDNHISSSDVGKCKDVNYLFFQNKDGLFGWRPLQLINPVAYVCLVNLITKPTTWRIIQERFTEFQQNPNIVCYSIPAEKQDNLQNEAANAIFNWWTEVEQQTVQLALEYNYMLNTDITDCYGSLYTHAISWAMCGIETAKAIKLGHENSASQKDAERYKVGNSIDMSIENVCYRQTNGIPQGSTLMDFIAELVLGYADLMLTEAVEKAEIKRYKIIRYRDDYRIFGRTREDVMRIAVLLTRVLARLNFKLNVQKTFVTQDLIHDAIKKDKWQYIVNDYKQLENEDGDYTLQKHLICIYELSLSHPNSGSLQRALDNFLLRICDDTSNSLLKETSSAGILVSIVANIAYNSPKVYKQAVAVISKILSYEPDRNERLRYFNLIEDKFRTLPNIGYLEIWLQRLTIKDDRKRYYSEGLCQHVADKSYQIWNLNWLNPDIRKIVEGSSIVDESEIEALPSIIEHSEIETFSKY